MKPVLILVILFGVVRSAPAQIVNTLSGFSDVPA